MSNVSIYLDNCCFNRPYDDQEQLRILLETEAKLRIQENVRSKNLKLIWSYILDYENSKNPFSLRRTQIAKWRSYAVKDVEEDDDLLKQASLIASYQIKKQDSMHIACAIKGNADYFLTTDDGILNKSHLINNIKIIDPIGFIKEVSV